MNNNENYLENENRDPEGFWEKQERLLLKCDNTIFADEIVGVLEANGIVSRQHDESMDTVVGAYGAVTGIAFYVFEDDYDRARELIDPIVKARNKVRPICPKCGSEEVAPIARKRNDATALTIISILLLLIPGLYIAMPAQLGLRSHLGDIAALMMTVAAFVILISSNHWFYNFRCTKCGHKFHR